MKKPRRVPKAKLSVAVDKRLLDRAVRLGGGTLRSEIVEQALAKWVRQRSRQRLEEEIETYYRGMSEQERGEDNDWAALGDDGFREAD